MSDGKLLDKWAKLLSFFTGEALQTFVIDCQDWIDDDGQEPTYLYEYELDGEWTQLTFNKPSLPQGKEENDYKLTVVVKIFDEIGSYTAVSYAVKVRRYYRYTQFIIFVYYV